MFKLPGIPQELGNDLVLRACASKEHIEKVAALNAEVHGKDEGAAVRRWLLQGHPQLPVEGWLFVEDKSTGEAVATLSLMPLTWRLGKVSLPVAEMGFVASRPAYRRRGLQRALSAAFDRVALANHFTLAAIEGIPFFYRQFGYEYALPLFDSRYTLPLDKIPAGDLASLEIRPAELKDLACLMGFYQEATASLSITTERSEAMWRYYLGLPTGIPFRLDLHLLWLDGECVGYVALMPSSWVNRLNIMELAVTDNLPPGATRREAILAALSFAGRQAEAGGYESVGLQLPARHPACVIVRYMGIREERLYGWQMKVLDPVAFLNAIRPTLEDRLAHSVLRGSSGELNFDLYRQKVGLQLEAGQVRAAPLALEAETHVSLPPLVATQLCLGWRSFSALDDWHQDVGAREEKRHLLDVLFPALDQVHIYLGY